VVRNHQAGAIAGGEGASLTVRESVVRDTLAYDDGTFGDGLVAVVGATALFDRVWTTNNARAGLMFAGSTAALDGVVSAANAIGIQAQDGSMLTEVETLPGATTPLSVLVSQSSAFVDNGTRVGTGTLAVPELAP
jgi:hypothetical protein